MAPTPLAVHRVFIPSRRSKLYSHHHLRLMLTPMGWATACKEANLPAQVLQNDQITQRYMGWTGVLPPMRSHTQQHRYVSLTISPPNSHFSQLHLNLTDAAHWMNHYNGFSYEEFYEFIIDFFEADTTPEAQEASAELLGWWNKYVSGLFLPTPPLTRNASRVVFLRSAATRAAAPRSARQASLAILQQQRQAAPSSNPPS